MYRNAQCHGNAWETNLISGSNSAVAPGISWCWLNRNSEEGGRDGRGGKEGPAPTAGDRLLGTTHSAAAASGPMPNWTDQTCLGFLGLRRGGGSDASNGDCECEVRVREERLLAKRVLGKKALSLFRPQIQICLCRIAHYALLTNNGHAIAGNDAMKSLSHIN